VRECVCVQEKGGREEGIEEEREEGREEDEEREREERTGRKMVKKIWRRKLEKKEKRKRERCLGQALQILRALLRCHAPEIYSVCGCMCFVLICMLL
jgi:hypothetical protein